MIKIFATALIGLLAAAPGAGAGQVGDRALAECQERHSDFAMVRKCLAPTHIALKLMDLVASDAMYGAAGARLVEECRAEGEASVSVWSCASSTLWDADRLLGMVGSADKISDPEFAPLADQDAYAAIRKAEDDLRLEFRDDLIGGTYFP